MNSLVKLWERIEYYRYDYDNLTISECLDLQSYIPVNITTDREGLFPLKYLTPRDAVNTIYRGKLYIDGINIFFISAHHPINSKPSKYYRFLNNKKFARYGIY